MNINDFIGPKLNWDYMNYLTQILYEYSLKAHQERWLKTGWAALERANLTAAHNDLECLDTILRGFSLAHFHNEIRTELNVFGGEWDYNCVMDGFVREDEIRFVLSERYEPTEEDIGCCWTGIESAFLHIYSYHISQIVRALENHFGSFDMVLDSIIQMVEDEDGKRAFLPADVSAARDYLFGVVSVYGSEDMTIEVSDAATGKTVVDDNTNEAGSRQRPVLVWSRQQKRDSEGGWVARPRKTERSSRKIDIRRPAPSLTIVD